MRTPVLLFLVCFLAISTVGQTSQPASAPSSEPAPAVPTLTDTQRLTLQTLQQQIEIAQLRFVLAQRDHELAQGRLKAYVAELQVPGYRLDLDSRSYAPAPEPER